MAKVKKQLGDNVTAFSRLHKRREKARLDLKRIEKEYDILAEKLLEQFLKDGIDSISSNGITAYVKRRIFAYIPAEKREKAIKVLKARGLEFLAPETVNANTLSAWVRELEEKKDGMPKLPRALQNLIVIHEEFKVQGRKK